MESADASFDLLYEYFNDLTHIAAIKIQSYNKSDDTNNFYKLYHTLTDITTFDRKYLFGQYPSDVFKVYTSIIEYNPFMNRLWLKEDLTGVAVGMQVYDRFTDVPEIKGYCEGKYDFSCCYLLDGTHFDKDSRNYLILKLVDCGES